MWVVVHTYVGLALASMLHVPFWQMVVVVLASHVLLDPVPHWDYTGDRGRILLGSADILAALNTVIALLVLGLPFATVALGVISGLPDLDVASDAITGRKTGHHLFPSHWQRFPHGQCGPTLGIPLQLVIVVTCAVVVVTVGL